MHHVYVVNKTHQMQKPLLPCILKMYFLFKQNCGKKLALYAIKKMHIKSHTLMSNNSLTLSGIIN